MIEPASIAVIFTSTLSSADDPEYASTALRMEELAREQDGFISVLSIRDPVTLQGVTVSYWRDEQAVLHWKQVLEHLAAQERGRSGWYTEYSVVVARVTRSYSGGQS